MISPNFANLIQASLKVFLRVYGTFLGKEGGIQALAGTAPSCQTVGSLLRTACGLYYKQITIVIDAASVVSK